MLLFSAMRETRRDLQPPPSHPSESISSLNGLSGPPAQKRQNRAVSVDSPSLTRAFRYIDNPAFHEPGAWKHIVESPLVAPPTSTSSSRASTSEDGLACVVRHPLLSQEATRALFLKMNFLKFCAAQHILPNPDHTLVPDKLVRVTELLAQAMEVRNTLLLSNTRLAVKAAAPFVSPRMSKEDLASHGFELLLKCVDLYDCSQPAAFSNYAMTSLQRAYARAAGSSRARRDLLTFEDNGVSHPEDTRAHQASEELRLGVIQRSVRSAVQQLPTKERIVVESYLLAGGTLQDAGDLAGVTKEGARLIKLRAISRLKGIMGRDPLEDLA
jgi:RNA polymerase sigma factor (sigma-70 family)